MFISIHRKFESGYKRRRSLILYMARGLSYIVSSLSITNLKVESYSAQCATLWLHELQ